MAIFNSANTVTMLGAEIKTLGAIKTASGNWGRVGGTLCVHSTALDPDQTGARDYFDSDTDFRMENGMKSPIFYHHGLHPRIGVKEMGEATLERDSQGVQIPEGRITLDDADGRKTYEGLESGELAWSSGTVAHLVRRTRVATKTGLSHHIDFWPLGLDASLTPAPAEPRALACAMKTLVELYTGDEFHREVDVDPAVAQEIAVLREILSDMTAREMRQMQVEMLQRELIGAQMDVLSLRRTLELC